jgi:hypothetical protein
MAHFKAKHKHNDKVGYFEFKDLAFAKYKNPDFVDWEEVE